MTQRVGVQVLPSLLTVPGVIEAQEAVTFLVGVQVARRRLMEEKFEKPEIHVLGACVHGGLAALHSLGVYTT